MKKYIIFILIGCFTLFLFRQEVTALDHFYGYILENDYETYKNITPKITPNKKLFSVDQKIGFNNDDIDLVYDDSWVQDTLALEYGYFDKGNNDLAYYFMTLGGGYNPKIMMTTDKTNPIHNSEGVMLYVDINRLLDSSNAKIGIKLHLSNSQYPFHFNSSLYLPFQLKDNEVGYYFDFLIGNWVKKDIINTKIALPENYTGWMYFPFLSFEFIKENNFAEIRGQTLQDAFNNGYNYCRRFSLETELNDLFESQTMIIFDEIMFISEKSAEMTLDYELTNIISPTCTHEGGELYTCKNTGQIKIDNIINALDHVHNTYEIDKDGLIFSVCEVCGSIVIDETKKTNIITTKDIVTVTFNYMHENKQQVKKFLKGHQLTYFDIPMIMNYTDYHKYQFNCWTSDNELITPLNPVGYPLNKDITFYARYSICSYDNQKYYQMISIQSFNGGPYYIEEGKAVFSGDSNYALYHTIEEDMAPEIPTYNNSIAGSTTYNRVYYLKELILSYKPKLVIINGTTNDFAYHNMTDRAIKNNFIYMFEEIRRLLPETVVVFVGHWPLPGRTEWWDNVLRLSNWMKEYSNDEYYLEYFSAFDKIRDYAMNYPANWDTWTHLDLIALKDTFNNQKEYLKRVIQTHGIIFS